MGENRDVWLLLVDILLPTLSTEGRSDFSQIFFGYGSPRGNNQVVGGQSTTATGVEDDVPDALDIGMAQITTEADGLGWMEDVWRTVLWKHTVDIDGNDTPWSESSGFILATSPMSTHTRELVPLSPSLAQNESSEGAMAHNQAAIEPETKEEHLKDSA